MSTKDMERICSHDVGRWTLDHQLLTSQMFVSQSKFALSLRLEMVLIFKYWPGWIEKVKAGVLTSQRICNLVGYRPKSLVQNPVKNRGGFSAGILS